MTMLGRSVVAFLSIQVDHNIQSCHCSCFPSSKAQRRRRLLVRSATPTGNDSSSNLDIAKYTLIRFAAAALQVPSDVFAPSPPMLEPPAQTATEMARRQLAQELLDIGWSQSDDSFTLPDELMASRDGTLTYGEVTVLGARQLFYYMGLLTTNVNQNGTTVFCDLGSGKGKLVTQAYLEVPSIRKALGVELAPSRHATAVDAWNRIVQSRPKMSFRADIKFLNDDMFATDLSEATHVYVASLCFTDTMMDLLVDKLRTASNLICIATLKELPGWKHKIEYAEMSWTRPKGCAVYFYFLSNH